MKIAKITPVIAPYDGFLANRFRGHFAQIKTEILLRLKSTIKDVHRVKDGYVSSEIEAICKKLPIPPQGIPDKDFVLGYTGPDGQPVKGILETDETLKAYVKLYPEQWAICLKALGIPRQDSVHACHPAGVVICTGDERFPTLEIEKCNGFLVQTGQGATAMATLLDQGTQEVMEYTLENGELLLCTKDHLVLTDKGWMAAEQAFLEKANVTP